VGFVYDGKNTFNFDCFCGLMKKMIWILRIYGFLISHVSFMVHLKIGENGKNCNRRKVDPYTPTPSEDVAGDT
jgi:hypothetical protein